MPSDAMEDYLKTLYEFREAGDTPVGPSALADRLDVTPPTATAMLEKLHQRGLVEREKYEGARLTDDGEAVALEVIRHHRLLETFLIEQLGYDLSAVHEEADRLEHHISERFERQMAEALDHPRTDPHGDPIPCRDLTLPSVEEGDPLSEREAGDRVVVTRVRDRDEEELEYLASEGIEPGRTLSLREVTPVGTYVVAHQNGVGHLPESVAETIRVRPASIGPDPSEGVTDA